MTSKSYIEMTVKALRKSLFKVKAHRSDPIPYTLHLKP